MRLRVRWAKRTPAIIAGFAAFIEFLCWFGPGAFWSGELASLSLAAIALTLSWFADRRMSAFLGDYAFAVSLMVVVSVVVRVVAQ